MSKQQKTTTTTTVDSENEHGEPPLLDCLNTDGSEAVGGTMALCELAGNFLSSRVSLVRSRKLAIRKGVPECLLKNAHTVEYGQIR